MWSQSALLFFFSWFLERHQHSVIKLIAVAIGVRPIRCRRIRLMQLISSFARLCVAKLGVVCHVQQHPHLGGEAGAFTRPGVAAQGRKSSNIF